MLASTVQFSTYGKSLHIPHRQTPAPTPGGNPGTTTGRYDRHEALHETTPTPAPPHHQAARQARAARSLRTQQRAYEPAPTDHHVPRPGEGAVLAATCGHRPNWSAFHPRAPPPTPAATPQRGDHHGRRVALDRPPTGRTRIV